MGRPSRKRPRPPPYTEAENSVLRHEPQQVPRVSHPLFNNNGGNNGLQPLVIGSRGGTRTTATAGEDADEEAAPTAVQQVWGALSETDIATAPANVEVDEAGVAWLVNTPTREQTSIIDNQDTAVRLLSEKDCHTTTPILPQQSISDHHGAVAAAVSETSTYLPLVWTRHHGNGQQQQQQQQQQHHQHHQQQDETNVAPPPGVLFCPCNASLREQLSRAKGEFDEIPAAVFKRVRSACNPAEALGRGSFLNRSAMKLANIDAVVAGRLALGSGGSKQEDAEKQETAALGEERRAGCEPLQAKVPPSIQPAAKALLFADLCGGPGGFSEYLLRRRRQIGLPARGWGISLREGEGDSGSGSGSGSGIGIIDSTAVGNCRNAATMGGDDDDDTDNNGGGGDHLRNSFFSRNEETATAIVREKTGSTMMVVEPAPVPAARSTARRSSGGVAEGGWNAHHGVHQDGIKKEEDPCAWRLNHLQPWCDVSVSTAGMEISATATTKVSGRDNVPNYAKLTVTSAATATATATATAADSAVAPLLEMRIDYGPHGTGDVTDVDNMQGFVDTILASTAERRLDLVVADGGFGAARDALEQETLLSPLVHSEALTALLLLEEGGSFVCKLFECWTESTAALVYLLHRKFRRTAIVKPITSRPASGERYLVCTGYFPPPPSPAGCRFTNALRAKVQALQGMGRWRFDFDPVSAANSSVEKAGRLVGQAGRGRGGGTDEDVATVDGRFDVALGVEDEMKQDASFMWYLRHSNNLLASLQAKACAQIVDVASTKRGRAWAFQDSNSSRNSGDEGRSSPSGGVAIAEVNSSAEGAEESDENAAALRCFWRAWGLNKL